MSILPGTRIAVLLALVLGATPARALTLDPYSEPMPPNVDLSVTQQRILFHGDLCDAVACPPGTVVTHTQDFMTQDALASLGGASRSFDLDASYDSRVVLSLDTSAHRLVIAPADGGMFRSG